MCTVPCSLTPVLRVYYTADGFLELKSRDNALKVFAKQHSRLVELSSKVAKTCLLRWYIWHVRCARKLTYVFFKHAAQTDCKRTRTLQMSARFPCWPSKTKRSWMGLGLVQFGLFLTKDSTQKISKMNTEICSKWMKFGTFPLRQN